MKKLFTLLTMLALTITGVQAQNHHVPYTGQNFLNASTLKSNVAAAEGDYLVALQIHAGSTFYINNQGKAQSSSSTTGETTWIVEKTSGDKYLLKTFNGKYIKTLGADNNTAATFTTNSSEALKFNPVQSTSTDVNMESGYVANKAIWWNVDGGNKRINTNGISGTNKTIFQNTGTGCWTCLFTYEVVKKYKVTFNCKVGETLIYTESTFANTGDVLNVPDLPGYSAFPSSFTVGNSDASVDISYTPDRYPVNFKREQTFTRSDRHINSVTFDIGGDNPVIDGLYVDRNTKCYQDLTETKTVTLPVNTSVQPQFSATGAWQHGFVYIDLNNDGDFTDDGELVSKINEGNPNLSTDMPSFTTSFTPGTYRMRIKTDWESEDPGGYTGNAPHEITSNNHIIANGGMIVDVNLVIEYEVTYQVQDENKNVLFTSSAVAIPLGTNITTLPAQYQKADFYDYNTLDITISDLETTAVFTATKKDAPLVKYTADTTDPDWYKMKLKNANYPTYVADGTPNVTTPTTNADDETVQWAFIGEPYAGFHIICRAAKDGNGKYLVLGSGTTTGSTNNGGGVHATFADEGSQVNELWDIRRSKHLDGGFFLFNGEGHALNQRSTSNLAYWTADSDLGSTFTVTEVLKGEALFNALIEELETYPYGTGVNHYHFSDGTYTYYAEVLEMISALKTAGYSESTLNQVQALKDGTSINQPTSGFYRIKGHGGTNSSEKYMASGFVSVGSTNMFPMTTETDATTIFYYDGTKLTNFSSGMCNGVTSSDWAWVTEDNASTVTFQDGLTFGGYVIQTKNAYFYDNGNASTSHVDRGSVADISGIGKRYRNWYLEEVTSLPVTFNSSALGYATFCCPVALKVPAEVEAYLCKRDGSTLRLFKADQITDGGDYVLPAGTAVLLYNKDFGTDDTKYFTVTSATDKYDNNGFIGTVAAKTPDYSSNWYYALRKKSGSMGFYQRSDQSAALTGFRAWLEIPKSEGARDFTIVFGGESDPTGIVEALGLQNDNVEIYDLNGRKLSSCKNGINIVNGKKVFK